MKKILAATAFAAVVLCVSIASAQTQPAKPATPATSAKPAEPAQPEKAKSEWKEKDEFHKVMAQTFHPMEEGNYDPIRKRSGELHEKAVAWQKSTPPAEFNNEKIATTLKQLVVETKRLDDTIKGGAADAAIGQALTKTHDTFHEIVGLCSPGHHDHDHGGHKGHDHSDPNHKH